MDKFSPKDPLEIIPLEFNFVTELGGVQKIQGTPVCAISVYKGEDANPSDLASGVVTVLGDRAHQNVKNGLAGVEYLIKITITTNTGLKYTIGKVLPVKDSGTY